MASSSLKSDPFCLTPLDNMIGPEYVHLVLFFPDCGSDVSSLVQNMTSALAQTFNAIPFLAGTVTQLPATPQKGRMAVTAPWRTPKDAIKVKDLRKTDHPSYQALRSKGFPMVDIDYSILMPTRIPSGITYPGPPQTERPVLMAQINFIKGGMILGLAFDHYVTDGAGSVTIARVWAAYCRGEDGAQLVSPDCIDRTRLMEGDGSAKFEDFEAYKYYPDYYPEPPASAPTNNFLSPMFKSLQKWIFRSFRSLSAFRLNAMEKLRAILRVKPADEASRSKSDPLAGEVFFFSQAKLKELKDMASKDKSDETSWISTNDALASLLWCCVTPAHKADINNVSEKIKDDVSSLESQVNEQSAMFGFVMNARRIMGLPARFIGNVVIWGGIIEPFSTVTPTVEGVTACAHSMRRKLKQYDDTHLLRLAGAVKTVPDASRIRLDRMGFDARNLAVNSWASYEWYDFDWGRLVGGRCERLRIGKPGYENWCLVLPELKGGGGKEEAAGLEVVVSLEHRHMKVLRETELFNRFAEWRCS